VVLGSLASGMRLRPLLQQLRRRPSCLSCVGGSLPRRWVHSDTEPHHSLAVARSPSVAGESPRSTSTDFDVAERLSEVAARAKSMDLYDAPLEGVTIVRTVEKAKQVVRVLEAHPEAFHACDTEVAEIDLSSQGPVGNGEVICFSIFSGPDVDFGEGPNTALWVECDTNRKDVLQVFKPWFEDERYKKVWHNYGFDRHVLFNEGINAKGLGGDTMHMARLWDSGRDKGRGGYGLEALTETLLDRKKEPMKKLFGQPQLRKDGTEGQIKKIPDVRDLQEKPEFRRDWIKYSSYDAESTWWLRQKLEGHLKEMTWEPLGLPGQKSTMWDFYTTYYVPFGELLTDMEREGIFVDTTNHLRHIELKAKEDREEALRKFRDWAGSIDPAASLINPASTTQLQTFFFGGAQKSSKQGPREKAEYLPTERVFEAELDPDLQPYIDKVKAQQAQQQEQAQGVQAGSALIRGSELEQRLNTLKAVDLKDLCKKRGLKCSGKKSVLIERILKASEMPSADEGADGSGEMPGLMSREEKLSSKKVAELKQICKKFNIPFRSNDKKSVLIAKIKADLEYLKGLQNVSEDQILGSGSSGSGSGSTESSKAEGSEAEDSESFADMVDRLYSERSEAQAAAAKKKRFEFKVQSLKLPPTKYTTGGWPAVSADVLRALAGDPKADPPEYGAAFSLFNSRKEGSGKEACEAIDALHSMSSIDTMLSNFIEPLINLADANSRVHCSMNINTETGRLSARRPNLQNQPALEKDQYRIRSAFCAEDGKRLIVADYGQLELRLLAHITKCKSMIDAFASGGCFHSRTAAAMFPHVKAAVDSGEVLLEWDHSKGEMPAPLLKDVFGSERRKAKTLNFSIAYGKTVHGLSKDWDVSVEEAKAILDAWYADRPEVLKWQKKVKEIARDEGYTKTLMGRYRSLPGINEPRMRGHAERAAINTPIQGGAADIVVLAMLRLRQSELLRKLGYRLLLQVHDEVILEGPEDHVDEALEEVRRCMEAPWDGYGLTPLAVDLVVDAKHAKTWYEAK